MKTICQEKHAPAKELQLYSEEMENGVEVGDGVYAGLLDVQNTYALTEKIENCRI